MVFKTAPKYYKLGRTVDFPSGTSAKESACQCRSQKRHRFDPWVGKMPWRRRWQRTAESLPSKSHGQRNLVGYSPWDYKHQTRLNNWAPAHTELWKSKCGKSFVLLSLNFFLLLIQCWITKNKIYKWKDKSFYIYYNSCLWNVNYLAKFNWINNHACLVLWEPQFIVKIQNVF